MHVAIATGRQAHYRLPANSFLRRDCDVSMYTATPKNRMRGFGPDMRTHWIPAPVAMLSALTHSRTPLVLDELDSAFFDRGVAMALGDCGLFLGASSSSLVSGKAAQKMGAVFVLDRACPDVRVQQDMLVEEARKAGGWFRRSSSWFLDRQVEEYDAADFILTPSDYSRRSFPEALRKKMILAPLCGRARITGRHRKQAGSAFVLGVIGGSPLRKGYLYLLEAWKRLALPDAQLKIRTSNEIYAFSTLKQLVTSQSNIHVIEYMEDIRAFYADCDAYILPSVDDGFGMSLFEAIGSGIPSIATRHCGASELLVSERDFLLIDAFSVDQIEAAVLHLYESKETRERLGEAGILAVERLEKDGVVERYEAGIDDLLFRMSQTS